MHRVAKFALVTSAFIACLSQHASGDDPQQPPVDVDLRLSFSCRDVTPEKYAEANPGLRVMEVRIPISANIRLDESEVQSIIHRITASDGTEIVDFLPKTEVGSELAAPYVVGGKATERTAKVSSLEGGAKVGFIIKEFGLEVAGNQKVENSSDASSEVEFRVLPPKKLVVAAGTENRGHTIYFELKPFSQLTLKGQREFVLLLAVPKAWEGGCCQLESEVKSRDQIFIKSVAFALYRSGDMAAKAKYEAMASATIGKATIESASADSKGDVQKSDSFDAKLEAARRAVAELVVEAQAAGRVDSSMDPPPIFDLIVNGYVEDGASLRKVRDSDEQVGVTPEVFGAWFTGRAQMDGILSHKNVRIIAPSNGLLEFYDKRDEILKRYMEEYKKRPKASVQPKE